MQVGYRNFDLVRARVRDYGFANTEKAPDMTTVLNWLKSVTGTKTVPCWTEYLRETREK